MENKTLFELVEFHRIEIEKVVGNTRSISTYLKHLLTIKKLEGFVKYQYNQQDINLSDIQFEFIVNFENYLLNVLDHKFNTLRQHSINLRTIISFGVQHQWIASSPFKTYQTPYEDKNNTILTIEELKMLMSKSFKVERVEIAKNLFIFQCFTGLGYVEITNLTKSNIQADKKGQLWINLQDRTPIPLFPQALKILEKYQWQRKDENSQLLPTIRNQSINAYLIEIADLSDISKKITNLVGRRTFGVTIALKNGVPIEWVSKLLGHSNLTTTQEFLGLINNCPEYDFNLLRKKISETF
jgi:integrase